MRVYDLLDVIISGYVTSVVLSWFYRLQYSDVMYVLF